jgi:spore coat protein JC
LKYTGTSKHESCAYKGVAEQKARATYDNILRMVDDPDVRDPIIFLREREIVHFQRFGEGLEITRERMNRKNLYAINPAFDK